jgi:hypothetical protein
VIRQNPTASTRARRALKESDEVKAGFLRTWESFAVRARSFSFRLAPLNLRQFSDIPYKGKAMVLIYLILSSQTFSPSRCCSEGLLG